MNTHTHTQPVYTRVAGIALRAASSALDPATSVRFYEEFKKTLSEGDVSKIAVAVLDCLNAEEQVTSSYIL